MEDCKTLPGIEGCQICWAKLCWGHGGRGAGLFISPSGTWCEHCEHERYLIMKHHEVLETFGNRCRTTALQTEQYGAIIMHSYAHRNKAKQGKTNEHKFGKHHIHMHHRFHNTSQGLHTSREYCSLNFPAFSSSHGHDYLEVHVGSSPSPESQLPREKLLVRLAWPKSKRLRKERQHKQKSKCSQVQLKTELAKIPKQLCFSRLQTLRYWYADAVTGNLLMHTLAITQCQVTLISFLEIQTTFFHVMRWFLIWLICLLRQIFFALKPAIFQSLDVV